VKVLVVRQSDLFFLDGADDAFCIAQKAECPGQWRHGASRGAEVLPVG
jgi:hypothetical protein